MSRKPDIEKTRQMYRAYLNGLSLSGVAKRFGVSRQSVYRRFSRQGLRLRSKNQRERVLYRGTAYTRRDNGYYAGTLGRREFLHRVVWRDSFGPIPDGWDVHHLDFDRTNNRPDNLAVLPKAEHTRLHGFKNNQHTIKKCHA